MLRKLLVASNLLKVGVLLFLILAELNCLMTGIEYRFQYLLILYFILPLILILGIIEYFGLIKIGLGKKVISIFPFVIGVLIFILINQEGHFNPEGLSWMLILSFVIGVILTLKSIYEIVKENCTKSIE